MRKKSSHRFLSVIFSFRVIKNPKDEKLGKRVKGLSI